MSRIVSLFFLLLTATPLRDRRPRQIVDCAAKDQPVISQHADPRVALSAKKSPNHASLVAMINNEALCSRRFLAYPAKTTLRLAEILPLALPDAVLVPKDFIPLRREPLLQRPPNALTCHTAIEAIALKILLPRLRPRIGPENPRTPTSRVALQALIHRAHSLTTLTASSDPASNTTRSRRVADTTRGATILRRGGSPV